MELASGRGWTIAGETVHIRKQEELIKPKKILAKIDMESKSSHLLYLLSHSLTHSLFFSLSLQVCQGS